MRRILLVMTMAALMVVVVAFSALPALAQPSPACKGLKTAVVKSDENPAVVEQAVKQGCLKGVPELPPSGGLSLSSIGAAAGAALLAGTSVVAYGVLRRRRS